MEKRIKYQQFQQVKSAAKMIDPLKRKLSPLKSKIEELVAEYKGYQTQIDALEAGIVQVIGFHVDDLVKKVIEPTGKTDPKTNKPIMVTKYIPTDIVSYDEQHKEYVVTIPDAEQPVPTTEDTAGSDYDKDKEAAEKAMTHEEVSERAAAEAEANTPWGE